MGADAQSLAHTRASNRSDVGLPAGTGAATACWRTGGHLPDAWRLNAGQMRVNRGQKRLVFGQITSQKFCNLLIRLIKTSYPQRVNLLKRLDVFKNPGLIEGIKPIKPRFKTMAKARSKAHSSSWFGFFEF